MDFYAKIGQGDQDSMTGFTGGILSNIIAEHIELNIEEITQMYKDRFSPPKIQ